MSIDAGHWGKIVARVNEHARELHPHDTAAQKALVQSLLCITTEEGHMALIEQVLQYDLTPFTRT